MGKMNTNLKICLALSLSGILLLIFLSSHMIPGEYDIGNITEKNMNNYVAIKGQISRINFFEESEFYILTIEDDTGSITGTLSSKNLYINKTQKYFITGEITKYENKTQINIEKITKYDS